MKLTKKLFAILMAMVMVLGMGVTSFAATPDDDDILTVPVTVEIVGLPSNYSGTAQVGVLYSGNISIDLSDNEDPTAMDFLDAVPDVTYAKSSDGDYITAVNGLGSIVEEYTDHYYKGYSWMVSFKSGSSVTTTGTRPSWADPAPSENSWFTSTLAATNVYMNGNQFFSYNYPATTDGFTTSVEGITLQYVVTEASW